MEAMQCLLSERVLNIIIKNWGYLGVVNLRQYRRLIRAPGRPSWIQMDPRSGIMGRN